jgi:hypothetical protein
MMTLTWQPHGHFLRLHMFQGAWRIGWQILRRLVDAAKLNAFKQEALCGQGSIISVETTQTQTAPLSSRARATLSDMSIG